MMTPVAVDPVWWPMMLPTRPPPAAPIPAPFFCWLPQLAQPERLASKTPTDTTAMRRLGLFMFLSGR